MRLIGDPCVSVARAIAPASRVPGISQEPSGNIALSSSLPQIGTACLALFVFQSAAMIDSAGGQGPDRSSIVRFKRYVDPTKAKASSAHLQESKRNGNPLTANQPWHSQDEPLKAKTLENTQIIARVGSEVVLAGDILFTIDNIMEENRDRIPRAAWEQQRRKMMQQMLKQVIQSKLVIVDALQAIPEDNIPEIEKQVDEQFYNSRVKQLMKEAEVKSLAEFETKLKKSGSSIELQKRNFFERSLASQWIQQKMDSNEPVTHQEMLSYYTAHLVNYEQLAKCRWQQLTARFNKFESRQAAWQAIADMGNDVLIRKVPFEQVALQRSQGVTASKKGVRDWTSQGALVSAPLDQALFSLPVNQLSPIIEDSTGYHIVRVTERVDAHRTPFRDAQVNIQQKINASRREKKLEDYLSGLREKIYVWTIFDENEAADGPPQKLSRNGPS
jgi:parvulin-like peptidyl-prolyl isomerase